MNCLCDYLRSNITGNIIGRSWSERCPIEEHAPKMEIVSGDGGNTVP